MEEPILDDQNRQDFPEDFNRPQRSGLWEWVAEHNMVVIGGILLFVLAILIAVFFLRNRGEANPGQPNVFLIIKGPQMLASGNEGQYTVIYTNGENTDLRGITLEVFYPSNFKFASSIPEPTSSTGQRYDLPVLRQGQTAEVVIRGKVSGATGESKELKAKLNFTMANFSSEFSTEASYKTELTAPELEMEITGPIDVTNGQNTTFSVNYKNISNKEFDSTAVELAYPEGFKFASAVPVPAKGENYWSLGKLAAGATGKIEVTGSFVGDPGSEQQISGDLGLVLNSGLAPQIHASARFKLQSSSLTVTQTAIPKDVIELGKTINYTIKYANYGSTAKGNVVVTTTLEGPSLDMTKLKASNGIITGNTITWKSATVSGLSLVSPNQSGDLTFTVPLKQTVGTNLKNQTVKTTTTIYSDQDQNPIRGQELVLKVGTELDLIVSGRYVSGALPMQVGQATNFQLTFMLVNLSNDLSDTILIASMPLPSSAWSNVIQPESEAPSLTFDSNASKIRWKIGNLDAFVGKYTPAKTVTFQLSVTPSESDRGRAMTLLKDVQASGTDTFTTLNIVSTSLNQLTVSDLDDDQIDVKGSTVE
ncbi:MAG: hypothetical protein KW793_02190 [Candidatus Doudnabacteria bacterium]|nr:hypothetical protein [Candidatus Doudnabacteria bacterium]